MPRQERPPAAAGENRMSGDQVPCLEDADLGGQDLDLDGAPAGAVGDGIEVAAERDHAVLGDPPLQLEDGSEGDRRRRQERRLLRGEGLGHHAPGGAMDAEVGDLVQPVPELAVQVVEIAETAALEEVLADVAEGPLDLALGLGPVGFAGLGGKTVVTGEIDQGPVEDYLTFRVLADDRGFHAVVEDLPWHAAEVVEGRQVAAHDFIQALARHEAGEEVTAEAQHHGEQPDHSGLARLVGEAEAEVGEVDLGLLARPCLEAALEDRRWGRTDLTHEVFDGRGAARIAQLPDLPQETARRQPRRGRKPATDVGLVGIQNGRPGIARPVERRLQPGLYVLAHGLAVVAAPPCDLPDRKSLSMQIMDHQNIPSLEHRPRLPRRK